MYYFNEEKKKEREGKWLPDIKRITCRVLPETWGFSIEIDHGTRPFICPKFTTNIQSCISSYMPLLGDYVFTLTSLSLLFKFIYQSVTRILIRVARLDKSWYRGKYLIVRLDSWLHVKNSYWRCWLLLLLRDCYALVTMQ